VEREWVNLFGLFLVDFRSVASFIYKDRYSITGMKMQCGTAENKFKTEKIQSNDDSRFIFDPLFPNCFYIFFFGKMQNKGPPQSPLQPVDPSEPTVRKHPSAVGMVGRSDSLFK
jgi:hypothetical protein